MRLIWCWKWRQLSKEIKIKDEEVKALEERLSTILLDNPQHPQRLGPYRSQRG